MRESRKLIVVVENDTSLQQAVCRLLQAAGHTTWCFDSAEDALAEDVQRADCLLLDVRLPGLSGFELFDSIAARGRTIPAVFVSAYDGQTFAEQLANRQPSIFLAKPYEGPELLYSLERLIRLSL